MNLENLKFYQKLYGLSSSDKIKQWSVSVVSYDNYSEIIVDHGYIDGKIVSSSRKIEVGKNLGKSNETTHLQQALSEAESLVTKKKDEQYVDTLEQLKNPDEAEIPLPMLAHEYSKRKKYLKYPCYVQTKLNGVRCLIVKRNDECIAYSRGGKQYKAITAILKRCNQVMKNGDMLDGEIFCRELTFQQIVRAIKNETELEPDLDKLQYWIYDCVSDKDYKDRYTYISSLVKSDDLEVLLNPLLILTPTQDALTEQDIFQFHTIAVENNYEGTMIRNMEGAYTLKDRSNNLLKYKDFYEGEFQIVGGEEGDGLAKGQCILVCRISDTDHRTFKVRCVGANAIREEQWTNLQSYIGKLLTVKFQVLSDDGIPIFPVGMAVRDYE